MSATLSELIPIGEIVATHGLDGWLRLNPYNPETTALASAEVVFLEKDGVRSSYKLESSKTHKRQRLVRLHGVNAISAAESCIGSTLYVEKKVLDELGPGEYYQYQAIGMEVFDIAGNRLGVITRVWSTAASSLYIVQGKDKEHLIPAVKDIVEKVDLDSGRMIINPPEGLLDL